ncbi:putative RNA-directed DNA polymerase from transposon X-element [Trichonephila clavipes]|nr:putative RNA-directed DNA polymerase from transposon X-element [Trichonephila clavipes]
MLFVEENYKVQMAAITKEFPKIRSRLTGDFLKLYTDSAEERRLVVQLPERLKFQFYTIKAKAERPIKVVIKGLPRTTNPEEIKQDLEMLGYTPERVNQLIDIEYFIQTASNWILFGDFNASHNAWNCKNNTNRGRHLFNFANILNLNIAFPSSPTRFGHNSANTIDIALIKNFYYPFTINSIDDLSSDHNPVFLNFNFKLAVEPPNPRAVSTDWNVFKTNLNKNLSLFDFHPNSINSTNDLEQKIIGFTEAVIDTHSHASRPIETDRRNFTPHHTNQLLKIKNYFRKGYHQTLNPIFKSHYNRAQSDLKKELKKYNDNIWQKRLEALNTADNSLWRTQRFFKNRRPKIPPPNCATGTAVTDQQKANLLATNIKNNFVENDNYNQNDELTLP